VGNRGAVLVVLGVAALAGSIGLGGFVALLGSATDASSAGPVASGAPSAPAVPTNWAVLEQGAALTCPGLPWGVLAAIGRVVSDSGRAAPSVSASGGAVPGGEGPLSFSPAAFASAATLGPGGAEPPSPLDTTDALYSLATFLCRAGGASAGGLSTAIYSFLADEHQVDDVEVLAGALDAAPGLDEAAATAVLFAAGALGIPYVWGGTGPNGYDCSGLVQAAYRSGGVVLPRVAQDQYDAGPVLAVGSATEPGDLVFFGTSVSDVSHVGIVVAPGVMIDAPYTGVQVREDALPASVGDGWGGEYFVGVTRPEASL